MLAGLRVLAPHIPILSFTSIDSLMIVGSADWPAFAAWTACGRGDLSVT